MHLDTFKTPVLGSGVSAAATHDARIAACCMDAGAHELWSADSRAFPDCACAIHWWRNGAEKVLR